ncbi:J domain-containing protein [Hymenobacter aerophilus]|uniref:J domain-containing protein n=1 Tax=Hymenobacter aerophilus TaxID=119644 RepID=UPI00036D0866|nr:J domain-containing protein [Hymenobacter aerophilus]
MSTHYTTLGLTSSASEADIRRAYRQLVWITHPDRTPDPAAHARYLAVNDAYEVLSNPARRAAYDAALEWRATARPKPVTPPVAQRPGAQPRGRPPHSARQPPPNRPHGRTTPRTASFDLRPYAHLIRGSGRVLLAFGLLLLLDYAFLYRTTSTRVLALNVVSSSYPAVMVTTWGRIPVYSPVPANLLQLPLEVRYTPIFRFTRSARLPNGQHLVVENPESTLLGFVYFMLLLALLSQWLWLSLSMRLNSLMLASATAVLIVLLMLRH